MSVTLNLSKDIEATLAFQARAAQMPTERYVTQIVEQAVKLQRRRAAEALEKHLDVMSSQVAPGTTPDEMEAALEEALAAVRPQRSW
jgi:hypothetical protein